MTTILLVEDDPPSIYDAFSPEAAVRRRAPGDRRSRGTVPDRTARVRGQARPGHLRAPHARDRRAAHSWQSCMPACLLCRSWSWARPEKPRATTRTNMYIPAPPRCLRRDTDPDRPNAFAGQECRGLSGWPLRRLTPSLTQCVSQITLSSPIMKRQYLRSGGLRFPFVRARMVLEF